MDRVDASASEDHFQVLLAYLAANTTAAVPRHSRSFTHGLSQARQAGHSRTGSLAPLRGEARLCVSPERAAQAAQFAEFTALLERRADFFNHCASRP